MLTQPTIVITFLLLSVEERTHRIGSYSIESVNEEGGQFPRGKNNHPRVLWD
jgi:hypothetical protein